MRHRITRLLIVAASVLVVTIVLVAQAQDRFTLKSVNGIAFSEFRGYDGWQAIAVSHPDGTDGCGTSKDGCIKLILGNPTMIKAYQDGIPANGKPVPDGAAIAKIEFHGVKNQASPYSVTVPGTQTEVGFMVKDSKRFTETNGWGYATFQYDASAKTFKPAAVAATAMKTLCHACHTDGAKARDFVYTNYVSR